MRAVLAESQASGLAYTDAPLQSSFSDDRLELIPKLAAQRRTALAAVIAEVIAE
jgi:hypothetical protein